MKYRALWLNADNHLVVIDQRALPFKHEEIVIKSVDQCVNAITNMSIRGAGIIGNTAAFGVYMAAKESKGEIGTFIKLCDKIEHSRPTAVNLSYAVDKLKTVVLDTDFDLETIFKSAIELCAKDANDSLLIGKHGADKIEHIMKTRGLKEVSILTHCNAGYLAIVDNGTALAPIYELHRRGIKVKVYVDETRPRNQGANLTAWELAQEGIDHTIIADNTGGHLMQSKDVDLCIVGADRVSLNGDTANKIGTYLKALSAKDNDLPFFIALPTSTFDFASQSGDDIPIEIRDAEELRFISGIDKQKIIRTIQIYPETSPALNYSFDITPARLITAFITDRGLCKAEDIKSLFKDLL